jgi:hypothetical protein
METGAKFSEDIIPPASNPLAGNRAVSLEVQQ